HVTVAAADAVQVLDTATNKIVGQIPVGASPHYPLFTPNGKWSLVVSQGPGHLEILNPSNKTVSASVTVGKLPHWIAISFDGRTAYHNPLIRSWTCTPTAGAEHDQRA